MTSFVRQIIGFSGPVGAEDLRRRSTVGAQITMLSEIGRAMSSSMVSLEKTLELITEAVCGVLGVEKAFLFLVDEKRGELVARAGRGLVDPRSLASMPRIPQNGDSILARALRKGQLMPGQTEREEGSARAAAEAMGLDRFLAAPMIVEGRPHGVIVADTKSGGRAFESDDERLLMVLAYLAGIAAENAERVQRLKDKSERLAALLEVGRALNSTLELDRLLDRIVEKALELTHASTGAILLLDDARKVLTIKAARGIPGEVVSRIALKLGEGVTGSAAKEARTINVPDVSKEPRYVVANASVRSELAVPMFDEGRVIGVIDVDSELPDNFSEDDRDLLQTFAGISAVAIQNAALFEAARRR